MKKLFKKVSNWIQAKLKLITPGEYAIRGAAVGLLIFSTILFCIEAIGMTVNVKDPWILLFGLVVVLASVLLAYVGSWLLKLLYKIPKSYKIALTISIVLLTFVRLGDERLTIYLILVFSLIGAGIAMFRPGHWKKLSLAKKIVADILFVIGVAGLAVLIYFGSIRGLEIDEQINAASLTADRIDPISGSSPALDGNFSITTFTYGSGKDLRREEYAEGATYITESVDGRAFLDNWEKFGGWWREKYWGFDSKALPINARVWMPEGEGPFPLVLVVHGNHSMQDFSDPGYDYLGKHLASRGMILASVDENFINGSWTDVFGGLEKENDARGWLLLEHLRAWEGWNSDTAHPLSGKINMDKIALMGHSRGGEAIGHAAMLNALDYYPDDATIKLGYHFNIKSVVAIAPVDGQYKPGGSGTKFENVDYLTIHGAQDADVTSFAGSMQYERIKFTDSLYHFKSAVYISGANHGQFNTSWGDNDYGVTFKGILNLGQLMPAEEQEDVAKVFIGAFLEATLNDKKEYLPLFADARKGKDWLPKAVYLNQFEDSNTEVWVNYDEDFDVKTTSSGGSAKGENLTVWKEGEIDMQYGKKGSRAVNLGWNYEKLNEEIDTLWNDGNKPTIPDSVLASYTITFDSTIVKPDSTAVLVFALAESTGSSNPKSSGKWVENNEEEETENSENDQTSESLNEEEPEEQEEDESEDTEEDEKPADPLDFTIILSDSNGEKVTFLLSEFSHLQRQIKSRVMKIDFLDESDHSENIFQTFFFGFDKLKSKNPVFNPTLLQEIRFDFDQNESGVVILDQLGFTRQF